MQRAAAMARAPGAEAAAMPAEVSIVEGARDEGVGIAKTVLQIARRMVRRPAVWCLGLPMAFAATLPAWLVAVTEHLHGTGLSALRIRTRLLTNAFGPDTARGLAACPAPLAFLSLCCLGVVPLLTVVVCSAVAGDERALPLRSSEVSRFVAAHGSRALGYALATLVLVGCPQAALALADLAWGLAPWHDVVAWSARIAAACAVETLAYGSLVLAVVSSARSTGAALARGVVLVAVLGTGRALLVSMASGVAVGLPGSLDALLLSPSGKVQATGVLLAGAWCLLSLLVARMTSHGGPGPQGASSA